MNPDARLKAIIDWIARTTDAAGGRGALVPVSGGSDSALCFWLCAKALPAGRAVALHIGDRLRCREWFEALGPVHTLPSPADPLGVAEPEALRWAMALSHARRVRGWLVGSRNRTEEMLGTYSLASRAATYLPLAGLWKSEVMELCKLVGVPDEIIASSQNADPACGRPRELADIPFADVDTFLRVHAGEAAREELARLGAGCAAYLEGVIRRNRFKHGLPMRPGP